MTKDEPAHVSTPMDFDDLQAGQVVKLALHHPDRNPDEITTRFVDFSEESGIHRATFQEDGETFLWNIRNVRGKWVYGTNDQEFATIEAILQEGKDYIYDKHLTKLRTRASHRGIRF